MVPAYTKTAPQNSSSSSSSMRYNNLIITSLLRIYSDSELVSSQKEHYNAHYDLQSQANPSQHYSEVVNPTKNPVSGNGECYQHLWIKTLIAEVS